MAGIIAMAVVIVLTTISSAIVAGTSIAIIRTVIAGAARIAIVGAVIIGAPILIVAAIPWI